MVVKWSIEWFHNSESHNFQDEKLRRYSIINKEIIHSIIIVDEKKIPLNDSEWHTSCSTNQSKIDSIVLLTKWIYLHTFRYINFITEK